MKIPEIRYAKTTDGVHIAHQVMGEAPIDVLLVPGYASNLTAGSGLMFEDRGEHELKGVPDRWHLYTARSGSTKPSS